jgi:site-specific DNA-methyltransferase (adenine-specific)
MDLITTKEAAGQWGVTVRRVQSLCEQGLIDGAGKLGDIWVIPTNTEKPIDGRTVAARNDRAGIADGGKNVVRSSDLQRDDEAVDFQNQIVCGDSTSLVKTIPHEFVHAIISDIPYGIGYDEWDVLHSNTNSALGGTSKAQSKSNLFKRRGKPLNGWSEADKQIPIEYQLWVASWAGEWLRVVKPGASIFIFAGRQFAHRVITAMEESGFTFKDMLAWERDKAPHRAQHISAVYERRNDMEHSKEWKCWRLANLRPLFEPILWFQKPYKIGGTLADNIIAHGVGAWNESALRKYNLNPDALNQSNMIKVRVLPSDRGLHNTQKPLNLMKLLIELVTTEGQFILDPFAGSGTTILAAKETGRYSLGYEADDKIVQIANERLSQLNLNA